MSVLRPWSVPSYLIARTWSIADLFSEIRDMWGKKDTERSEEEAAKADA